MVICLFLKDRQQRSPRLVDMRSLLLLTVLLALIREGEGKPTVTLRPKFPQVFVGDDVTLICNHKGVKKTTTWFIKGKPQTPGEYVMLLTAVTPENNGAYECQQDREKSEPYTLTVLELEPFAQLSPSLGGTVMTQGDGRHLVLQADNEDLKGWSCFVLRGVSTFSIYVDVDEKMNRAVIFAELKEAERATFWCKKRNDTHRSNAVTLKKTEVMVMLDLPAVPVLEGEPVTLRCVVWGGPELEKAVFLKDSKEIKSSSEGSYTITHPTHSDNGNYSCHATYRFKHIIEQAAKKEGKSDPQELKVIGGGPPAAVITVTTNGSLQCSCPNCPDDCTSYQWYHTVLDDPFARSKLPEDNHLITVTKEGEYSCRKKCSIGFSLFSNTYRHRVQTGSNVVIILVALILIILGLLIVLLVALKRRRGQSSIQETKDKTTGGDYEQIQLKDKDKAVYHTLGQSKDQAEGGYEPLQKRKEEGVYHTVGPGGPGEGQGEGGYEALKNVKAEVYQTLSSEGSKKPGEGQSEGQGGYEALKNVKTEVYQTLSSDDSKKPTGEAEGGYEKLPQKDKDYETVTVEENPYEEVKKQTGKEKE